MGPSRREFLHDSLAAFGTFALYPLGCNHTPEPYTSYASMHPENVAELEPSYLDLEREGKLEQIEKELWEIFKECHCCPRECLVDRLDGDTGFCSSTARLKVASFGPHMGEEAPLVGRGGSGTIFFSNCNLLCCFCQNWEINHRGDGRYISHRELAETMLALQRYGCHNINLVTPTHVVPHIIKALRIAIPRGLKLPLVYNTGGYDNLEVIKKLDRIVDIYLPDFKYQDGELASKYSSGASDYPEIAAAVIKEMHRQVGELVVDERGIAQRGLIIRHLVMPENIAGTDRFVKWVAKELTATTYVNIMAQYRPEHKAFDYPKIARRITNEEFQQAVTWAKEAGLTNLDT
jgi:putative pyruvate formate lyase activating enzyme